MGSDAQEGLRQGTRGLRQGTRRLRQGTRGLDELGCPDGGVDLLPEEGLHLELIGLGAEGAYEAWNGGLMGDGGGHRCRGAPQPGAINGGGAPQPGVGLPADRRFSFW